ncbi:MAG: hypothetical protein AAFX79_01205 [Planctomycetota bacterium]
MGVLTSQSNNPLLSGQWQADVAALTDESHLVAWSAHPRYQIDFATSLGQYLQAQRHTEVFCFRGRHITNLESFCEQLERGVPGPTLARRVNGPRGVVSLLRGRDPAHCGPASRYRYLLWDDADVLLRQDRTLFSELVDAIIGVAAESEYVSDDLLLLQRAVFVGGLPLKQYADDEDGQFRIWLPDAFDEPFWQVVTGIDGPSATAFNIDRLIAPGGGS